MSIEDLHTNYQPDYYVVTVWNGTGSALVFESLESYQRMVDEYEAFRTAYSLPWVHGRPAVNGEHVLALYDMNLRPWSVSVTRKGVGLVKPRPLHHVTLELVASRYEDGTPRVLEIWAENEFAAKSYALDMMQWRILPEDSIQRDVNFYDEKEVVEEQKPAPASPPKSKAAPPPNIPGFGPVLNLNEL
jgi:hypothetical protein